MSPMAKTLIIALCERIEKLERQLDAEKQHVQEEIAYREDIRTELTEKVNELQEMYDELRAETRVM